MVVLSRNEVRRARLGGWLTLVLAAVVLIGAGVNLRSGPEVRQAIALPLAGVAVVAAVLSILYLISTRRTARVVLFTEADRTVIATNYLHEGFKLRFLRDVLDDRLVSFSDEERNRWSVLTREGYHPAFAVRQVRKPFLLALCFMIFDEVFVLDRDGRWDYFDCRATSEPTFPRRGLSPFKDDSIIPLRKRQPAT